MVIYNGIQVNYIIKVHFVNQFLPTDLYKKNFFSSELVIYYTGWDCTEG